VPTGWIIYDAKDPDTICSGGIVNTLNIDRPTRNDLGEDKMHLPVIPLYGSSQVARFCAQCGIVGTVTVEPGSAGSKDDEDLQ
jgi:hypothetical protein